VHALVWQLGEPRQHVGVDDADAHGLCAFWLPKPLLPAAQAGAKFPVVSPSRVAARRILEPRQNEGSRPQNPLPHGRCAFVTILALAGLTTRWRFDFFCLMASETERNVGLATSLPSFVSS
jgi:hypothetical protein